MADYVGTTSPLDGERSEAGAPRAGVPGVAPPPLPAEARVRREEGTTPPEPPPPSAEASEAGHAGGPGYLSARDLTTRRKRRLLGEMLIEAGYINKAQLERALAVQQMGGGRLGSILVRLKFLNTDDFRRILQEQLNVELVDLGHFNVDPDAAGAVPSEMVRRYEMVPLKRTGRGLLIGMLDPYNVSAIDDLRFATGIQDIQIAAITHEDYARYCEEHLQSQSLIDEILDSGSIFDAALKQLREDDEDDEDKAEAESALELKIQAGAPPIITLTNFILLEACRRNASDIHIEPFETFTRVRYRIDGMLHTLLTPPRRLHNAVISRLKVMADIDIANRRTPQDGRIMVSYNGTRIQMRVNTLPTTRGEKCVIRLAASSLAEIHLSDLALNEHQRRILTRAARNPQGMILVTGPTASGKSTTVRAMLGELNDNERNLVTLEDPVEVEMAGINHVPIQAKGGVSFSAGLRAILRQDPDIIFVGEIRDAEVGQIATRAALTGHLVLSTLHTNSAVATLGRLVDLGIEPFLVGSTVLAIVAQRLVRKICSRCTAPTEPTEEQIREFKLTPQELADTRFAKGRGCQHCDRTGYKGRMPLFEVLAVNAPLSQLIRQGAGELELLAEAKTAGFMTLMEDGRRKAMAALTTLDEVQRVTITVE